MIENLLTKADIMSAIFFVSSFSYTIMGFYGLSLNPKKILNKVFFLLSVSLAFWSICFSIMANLNPNNYAEALFFNKISVFGWGIFFSLVYHFFLLLAEDKKKISKPKYLLIYLPVLLNLLFFAGLGDISDKQFKMVFTSIGWVSNEPCTFINTYFTAYALSFSVLTITQIFKWHKNTKNTKIKKIILINACFWITVLILSTTTDILFQNIKGLDNLQLTIVWLFIPAMSMFCVLVKNRVMHEKYKPESYEIIDEQKQRSLFQLTGYGYLIIAYAGLFFNYFIPEHKLDNQFIWSLTIYIFGTSHFFLPTFFRKKTSQYIFTTVISIIFILLLSRRYYKDGAITIWTIFFYCIVITTVFEKSKYTYIITTASIIAQILNWYMMPRITPTLDWVHYSGRIIIIIFSVIVILYINKLYRDRIKENSEQIETQKLLAEISTSLIDANTNNMQSKIENILNTCNKYFEYSRSYAYKISNDNKNITLGCYCEGMEQNCTNTKTVFNDAMNYELSLLEIPLSVTRDADLNKFPKKTKSYLEEMGLLGFYVFPIVIDRITVGVLVFEFKTRRKNNLIYDYKKIIINLIADTKRKVDYEQKLHYGANYDKITGLKNGNGFIDEASKILTDNSLKMPAMILVDINNFKFINETFSYSMGDEILKTVGNILKKNISEDTVIARLSNDKFSMFCPNTENKQEIIKKLNILLRAFSTPILITKYELKANINIGIAVFPDDGENIQTLLKNADIALKKSKKTGKMKFYFCRPDDKEKTLENIGYTTELFRALSNNELILAYQPQINCQTGKIIGAEALLRWKSPKFGLVPPIKFIPILEHTGLIIRIGEWIMEQVAMQQAKMSMLRLPKIRLSVNLSVLQFQDESLLEKLKQILNNWVVDTDNFELEITEGVAMNEDKFLISRFDKIKELGCAIALDDFGVEFSSLNRLQNLPIDRLKIDKTFIDGIGKDKKQENIIKVIIDLAKALNLESIAEGVETKEQMEFLKQLGCQVIQGYYYSRPLFVKEFEQFIKDNS